MPNTPPPDHFNQEPTAEEIKNLEELVFQMSPEEEAQDNEVLQEQAKQEAAEAQKEDESASPKEVKYTRANTTYSTRISYPRDKGGSPHLVNIPPETEEVIRQALSRIPNIDALSTEKQRAWARAIEASLGQLQMDPKISEELDREDADWGQFVQIDGQKLTTTVGTMGNRKKGDREVVEGERALLQATSHLGVGGISRVPMWSSGFWVSFKPATDMEMAELNRMIWSDKIMLGRSSYGLSLSNMVVYAQDRVFDFALRHVYQTSVRKDEMAIHELKNHLRPQDIDSFIWGFLCAQYPSGFFYETPCIQNPSKCSHVIQETLSVPKLQVINRKRLTDWQKRHMTKRTADSMTLDQVKRYQDDHEPTRDRRFILNKGTAHEVALTLSTCSIIDYVNEGYTWVDGIVNAVNEALTENAPSKERDQQIHLSAQATELCQYAHWVKQIEFGDVTRHEEGDPEASIKVITDRDTIHNTLAMYTSVDVLAKQIMDHIRDYIAQSKVSVIGVPAFDCPVCGAAQEGELPIQHATIPLDILQTFFVLLRQRILGIRDRELV